MTILIAGASSRLGHLVVTSLLKRGVAPSEIIAGARNPAKVADLTEVGVSTVDFDYDRPADMVPILRRADGVLLISALPPGQRLAGHLNVIEQATAAGVSKLVYTSAPKATTFDYALAADHKATEDALSASGIPFVVLRNNWYTESYAGDLAEAARTGVVSAAIGDARLATAPRADYAEGAARVLIENEHLGRVYEFAGDVAWSFEEFAAVASEVLGRRVAYEPETPDEYAEKLRGTGLPENVVRSFSAVQDAIAHGLLADSDHSLSRVLERPTEPLELTLRRIATQQ